MRLFPRLPTISVVAVLLSSCDTPAPSTLTTPSIEAVSPVALGTAAESRAAPGDFAAEVVESPVVVVSPSEPAAGTGFVRAGVLTAGDIDDTLNLSAFTRYLARAKAETGLPLTNFASPVMAQLIGPDGTPAPGQRVTLRLPGAADPFYDGYSGVNGMVTVFPAMLGAGAPGTVELRAFTDQQEPVIQTLRTGTRTQISVPTSGPAQPDFLDLVFVVDATGSMGDELEWLTRDLNRIVTRATSGLPGVDTRYGLIVYRDIGDEYVVRSYAFTGSAGEMRRELRAQSADAGGDYPEAAAAAMEAAMALQWRRGTGERLLFQVADAPPHPEDSNRYLAAARVAARSNIQIFGLGASGVGDEAEFLMRQAAAQTGGRYLFLTDDSGVGTAHQEPKVSCYLVTELGDLMARVLRSELTGQRVEPDAGSVIRTVGSYQNGVCRE